MMKFQVKINGEVLHFEDKSDEITIEDVYSMDISPEQDAMIRDMMNRIQLQGSGGEIRGGIEVNRIRYAFNVWSHHRRDRTDLCYIQGPCGEIAEDRLRKIDAERQCVRLNERQPCGGRIYPPIPA
jgi:hypothetical protein